MSTLRFKVGDHAKLAPGIQDLMLPESLVGQEVVITSVDPLDPVVPYMARLVESVDSRPYSLYVSDAFLEVV